MGQAVRLALEWMRIFLDPARAPPDWQPGTGLVRVWLLSAYMDRGESVAISFDASPWGLGATIEVGGLSEDDVRIVGYPLGSAAGQ